MENSAKLVEDAKSMGGKVAEETAIVSRKWIESAEKLAVENKPAAIQLATELKARASIIADRALKTGAEAAKEFTANVVSEAPSAGETLRAAGQESAKALSENAELILSGNAVREYQLAWLRNRGVSIDDPTTEFLAIATYLGGHPSFAKAVAGGVLLVRPNDIIWRHKDVQIFIPHSSIYGLELSNYAPSTARSIVSGYVSLILRNIKSSVIVTCDVDGVSQNLKFQLEGTATVLGYEAVAKDFINHMAKHRSQFITSQQNLALQEKSAPPVSTADEISKLAELHARGVLTDEEFGAAKQKLLEL